MGQHTDPLGKRCNKCGQVLALDHFTSSRHGANKHGTCHACRAAGQRRDYQRQPERQYGRNLKSLYGITARQYEQLLAAQGGGCAICGKRPQEGKRRLHVDHDHNTGQVRGILCAGCNTGLGKLEAHLSQVRVYLAAPPWVQVSCLHQA